MNLTELTFPFFFPLVLKGNNDRIELSYNAKSTNPCNDCRPQLCCTGGHGKSYTIHKNLYPQQVLPGKQQQFLDMGVISDLTGQIQIHNEAQDETKSQ